MVSCAGTGAELWNFPAWYIDNTGNNVTAGMRYVPAVDPAYASTNPVGYIAYGREIIGKRGLTCRVTFAILFRCPLLGTTNVESL